MLFRTVYGPELESIYDYIAYCNAQGMKPKRVDIHTAFIPHHSGDLPSTQNVDDALTFLKSAKMISDTNGYQVRDSSVSDSFVVEVLRSLRQIECTEESPEHPIDQLYLQLLTELFIKPNRLFVADPHTEANQLRSVSEVGGLSREKIQTWKRVMEFLGIGQRVKGGFLGVYSPTLVETIVDQWNTKHGIIQSLFEHHLGKILPYAQANGDLADALRVPLSYLMAQGRIELFPLQDSPTRPYFGDLRYRGIARTTRDG